MESKRGWVAINRLKVKKTFGSIFPRDDKMIDAIAEHMKAKGYDQSQPIAVWDRTKEEDNKNALYIIDGHTRKCAAANAGISPVYVARMKFSSEEAALEYAIHNQRDRRNMTDADLLRCIQVVDSRKSRGGDRKSEAAKSIGASEPIDFKSSAQQTADIVGTSEAKVKKVRTILDHADEQTKQEIETGNKTVNKAYQETQQQRSKEGIPVLLRCDECRQEPKKVDGKTGKPFKHGMCSKCRKDKVEDKKQGEAKEEKRRQDFDAAPIDSEVDKNWLGLVEQIQNYRKSNGSKMGKISQETFDKVICERWLLDEIVNQLHRENWGYPREIKKEFIVEYGDR